MLSPRETEEMETKRLLTVQLFNMARASFFASEAAESQARRAKLEALKLQEELRVRLEIIDESLGREPKEPEYNPTREDSLADEADLARKDMDEHETNPGAA